MLGNHQQGRDQWKNQVMYPPFPQVIAVALDNNDLIAVRSFRKRPGSIKRY